jgi:hypothetical protein
MALEELNMAKKRIAVAVVHGMGSFAPPKGPVNKLVPSYSSKLHQNIRATLGADKFDSLIAWEEVFYSDILADNQKKFITRLGTSVAQGQIRDFVINNLGDPASYSSNPYDSDNSVYMPIRKRIEETMSSLAGKIEPDAPLLILAHSLGGHVISNHIWDAQHPDKSINKNAPFTLMSRVAALVTFGCNIPLFTFALSYEDIVPIAFPGGDLAPAKIVKPWWRNYYDRDDALGYPLAQTGKGYNTLRTKGNLTDVAINAGSIFTSWNAFSHNGYWGDLDLAEPIADLLRKF